MRSVLSRPSAASASASAISGAGTVPRRRVLLYFICGNPGLIDFYQDFFDCLRGLLDASERESGATYDLYGRNLLGFKDDEHEAFGPANKPWDLEGQIQAIYSDVAAQATPKAGGCYDAVVLMGHSVGSYIAVDIFHRHMKDPSRAPDLNLRHGMLLFPTLTSIAQSPSGKKLMLLHQIPTFTAYAHAYARAGLCLLPRTALEWIVHNVMGFTTPAAQLVAEWLKSRDGVWQALHLGHSEMMNILEETWGEGVWETAVADQHDADKSQEADAPKFFMLYGKDDHWVANDVRDTFMAKRKEHGLRGGRTKIVVDEGSLKHAFCTREDESLIVARKVYEWIEEIDGGFAGKDAMMAA